MYKAHTFISRAPISGKSEMCIMYKGMQNIFTLYPFTCLEPPLQYMTTLSTFIYYYTFVISFKNNYVCVVNIFFYFQLKTSGLSKIIFCL